MIYSVVILILLVVSFSCSREQEESGKYDITITGTVTDQVTGEHIEGATVSAGFQLTYIDREGLVSPEESVSTDPGGNYQILVTAEPYNTKTVSPGMYSTSGIAFIATKPGYIGSNRKTIHYYGAQNSVINLVLYHGADLNLHVINDTINNNIDAADIKLIKSPLNNPITVITLVCNGRKFDSNYIIKDLFGNVEYALVVLGPGGQTYIKYSVTPLPGKVNSSQISF